MNKFFLEKFIKGNFRRHFERTVVFLVAREILHQFIVFYFFLKRNGNVLNDKIDENLPPNIHKTIWITYYIELLKARKIDKYINVF